MKQVIALFLAFIVSCIVFSIILIPIGTLVVEYKPLFIKEYIKQQDVIINARITTFYATKNDIRDYHIDTTKIQKSRFCSVSREWLEKYKLKKYPKSDTIEVLQPFELSGKYVILGVTKKTVKNTLDIMFVRGQEGNKWSGKIKIKIK
jgi:hypothetical protein